MERYGGRPIILLHAIGAKSGRVRLTPLIPVFEGDDMFIFAATTPQLAGCVESAAPREIPVLSITPVA